MGRAYYITVILRYAEQMGEVFVRSREHARTCSRVRELARMIRLKAIGWHHRYKDWLEERFLHEGRSWREAVQITQRPYPGTSSWLLSCSASEGGWGRWVPNSQGSGVGGWMQMYPSTWSTMFYGWYGHIGAYDDLRARGFIVDRHAHSWYSPLGQALASAYGKLHGRGGEWYGGGC